MNDPWRINLPARVVIKTIAPDLEVPPGGWTAQSFARHGIILLRAMDRMSKITRRKAIPFVAKKALDLFRRQLEEVIQRAHARTGVRAVLESVTIPIVQNEHLWKRALDEVFARQNVEIVTELVPPIQSVIGQAYNKVSILLGHPNDITANPTIARQAREIAQKITNINDTTKQLFEKTILASINEGDTVVETAKKLRETLPQFERTRINTIARTETTNAWTQGSIAAFKESETLTHVSVIGCESREEDRWDSPSYQQFMYNGQSTCNIEDVPIGDADKLNFHPNHTGTVVPSKFRNEDGTID